MPETQYVPIGANLVAQRFDDLLRDYEQKRPERTPDQALAAALISTFNATELKSVRELLAGKFDASYPNATGAQFHKYLKTQLENTYVQPSMIGAATAAFSSIQEVGDIVTLAERLGTNVVLTGGFRTAVELNDESLIGYYVASASSVVEGAADQARTKIGRQVKVDQAVKVLQILAAKAARVPGDPRAANQALWCTTLARALKS